PHILPLIDSGEAGGLLYYVMPHVPGGSLRQRLAREPRLPLPEAIRIARDVGAALDYAHREGFVHRDVKPENILFADGHAVPADRFASAGAFVAALQGQGPAPGGPVSWTAARCIAVLPFVNASPDPDNEYLSDGITDELIAALAGVEGLRVASRTSVFALKGKPQDVRATGALLGAAWVLEGTVRRSGERLRITAQLTSTEDGQLLWSERYDRTFADVFAIQEEIARTIVDTLRVTSFADLAAPAAPVAKRYTRSLAAYGLYLKGRYAWNKRTQED